MTWSALLGDRVGSDRPAVVADDEVWSGDELMRRAAGAADWLDEREVPTGAPVAALLSTSAAAFALTIAGACTSRPLAPLGPKLTSRELSACVERLGSPVIVAEPQFEAIAAAATADSPRRVEVIGAMSPSGRRLDLDPPDDAVAAVLHTSGTSGLPKPVPYRQDRLAARVAVNAALLDLGPGCVYASSSPLHHIAGLGMFFVALGAGSALLTFGGFSVENWIGLGAKGVTHALLVPTTIDILLEHDALALPSLRTLQYGASPIHPDTLTAAMDALPGVSFVNIYGQTEGSPITCLTRDKTTARQPVVGSTSSGRLGAPHRASTYASRTPTTTAWARSSPAPRTSSLPTLTAGSAQATWAAWTRRAICSCRGDGETASSAAARTSIPARSRTSSSPTPG